jgi:P2 family phage contractile tail tube protein
MGFPFKLKKMDMLVDGVGHLAETEEVTIPKLALKTEDWLGGGMLGPVPIDMGLDKIEFEFSMGGLIQAAIARFGETSLTGSLVRFVGAYQDDQTGATRALESSPWAAIPRSTSATPRAATTPPTSTSWRAATIA